MPGYLVIYDGKCNLCVNFVKALTHLDQGHTFRYLPMQDQVALAQWRVDSGSCAAGMILLELANPMNRWQGSAAAEQIGEILPIANLLLKAYRGLPGLKQWGDRAYAQIRDHRYQWFGERDLYVSELLPPACETSCDLWETNG
ncbi:MAG: DCC1-like thiol-disulfide oxidoreductase family protein [Pseudanabaenaceae cyanobacterium bins.68]|nr:DCC1-like thiol-disulfide oxidoreductase family protein [Pseudanabaenaceae cyanobacterium bins.68]